jgi:molybdopterin synthase sulfur carrier subunit
LAEDTSRVAGCSLYAGSGGGGSLGRLRKQAARRFTGGLVSNEVHGDEQVGPKKKVIVSVMFHIPGPLREFTGGRSRVEIGQSPTTLAEALSALYAAYPGVRDRIATEQGQIREHINVFIGDEDIRYTGGLTSRVPAGTEISIVPAVSGG